MRRTFLAVALTASLASTAPTGLVAPISTLVSKILCAWSGNGTCEPPAPSAGCEWDPNGRCLPLTITKPDCTGQGGSCEPES